MPRPTSLASRRPAPSEPRHAAPPGSPAAIHPQRVPARPRRRHRSRCARAIAAHELHQLEHRTSRLAGATLLPARRPGPAAAAPDHEQFAYGAPATTPALDEVWTAWRTITEAADPWL